MPGSWEQALGGHTLLVVGYSDSIHRFIVRNSWGEAWIKIGISNAFSYLLDPNLGDGFLGNNDGRIIMYFVCIR
jgi:hypothetical protein